MSSAAERRWAAAVAILFLALALHGLGGADIVGDDEAREVGIVQDVLAGHWLTPTFNGEILPDKPLLFHWLAAVPCTLAGFSEMAVRLPSALATAGLVWWTARFGGALFGAPAGLVAAAMVGSMPAVFSRARVARPDALLVLLLCVALGLAFRWWRDGRRRDATLALVTLGAAVLAKGPVAPVLFALTLGAFLAWQRDLRRLRGFFTPAGVAAFLVLAVGWYAIALAGWGDWFVHEHLVGRYLRNLAGGLVAGQAYSKRSLAHHAGFYVLHLPIVALPWTPFVAAALWQAWRGGDARDPRRRFLACWAAAPLIAFTPAEYKLRYYLLPALPALALLTGPWAVALWRAPRQAVAPRTVALALAGVALAVAGLASYGLPALARSDAGTLDGLIAAVGGRVPLTALLTTGATLLLTTVLLRAWRALGVELLAGAALWMFAGQPALERAISARDSLKPFAATVAARVPAPAPITIFGDSIRPLVVYLGRRAPTAHRRNELQPGAVIAAEPAYARLAAAGLLGPPLAAADGRRGNISRARLVLAERTPAVAAVGDTAATHPNEE